MTETTVETRTNVELYAVLAERLEGLRGPCTTVSYGLGERTWHRDASSVASHWSDKCPGYTVRDTMVALVIALREAEKLHEAISKAPRARNGWGFEQGAVGIFYAPDPERALLLASEEATRP